MGQKTAKQQLGRGKTPKNCSWQLRQGFIASRIVIFVRKARGVSLIGEVSYRMKPEKADISKRPPAEQFWVCLQRYLQFDDPESKWERLLQLAIKYSRRQKVKIRQAERLPLADQQMYFVQTFGATTKNRSQVSTTFNILLALMDVEIFAPVAFDAWFGARNRQEETGVQLESNPFSPAIEKIVEEKGFFESQKAWLDHAAHAVPDWSCLLDEGPWSGDDTRQFIIEFMMAADLASVSSAAGILEAFDKFKSDLKVARARLDLPGQFFPRLILLVEGATETILMPHFARLLGCDFDKLGVLAVGTGGANQTSRKYLLLKDMTSIPIYIVLDADALQQVEIIGDIRRDSDRLHVWSAGDIEDTFAAPVLLSQINYYVAARGAEPLSLSQLPDGERRTAALNKAFRKRGLGDFDKIGFARSIVDRLQDPADVPRDAAVVIKDISTLLS
jgi:hypothetical protein